MYAIRSYYEFPLVLKVHFLFFENNLRNLLGKVLFSGENVFKQVKVISGGERAKLCFAIMMHERGNVLILDEPTNHLDLTTKEVLEKALEEYDGTIIFVSHDRYLLNRIATRILEVDKNSVLEYNGNFDFYVSIKDELRLAENKAIEAEKLRKHKESPVENKIYKNREQRSQEVKKKIQIKTIEDEIEARNNFV